MKNWYLTREGVSGFHRGEEIRADKFLLLSEKQAGLHNKGDKEFVVKSDKVPQSNEVQFSEELKVWEDLQQNITVAPEPTTRTTHAPGETPGGVSSRKERRKNKEAEES